jgi:DNA-binding NarL/FixJ family response regulator
VIIFVEDQEETGDLYRDEMLERDLPVQYFDSVDKTWAFLLKSEAKPRVAVIDVMMPPGDLFSDHDTADGLRTGLLFYRRIRERYPDCFVFLLTNLTAPVVKDAVREDPLARAIVKTDLFFDEVADEIEAAYHKVT